MGLMYELGIGLMKEIFRLIILAKGMADKFSERMTQKYEKLFIPPRILNRTQLSNPPF